MEQGLRELFHLDLLEAGIDVARRGMTALSLPVGKAELQRYVAGRGRVRACPRRPIARRGGDVSGRRRLRPCRRLRP